MDEGHEDADKIIKYTMMMMKFFVLDRPIDRVVTTSLVVSETYM